MLNLQEIRRIALCLALCLMCLSTAFAQSTEFTYQGKLNDGATPANTNYDFEFRLFSVDTGGAAIATLQRLGVSVSNGVFSVKLDFGAQFTGAARWLEIAVKPAGSGGGFQQLLPRQPVSSSPYSIRSLNAATADTATNATLASNSQQLGGVAANQYVLTSDARLSDARNPLPNSPNYIQNTTNPQASSNFNISGTGSADVVNAVTQFNIGGNRVLSSTPSGLYVGVNAGGANPTGVHNSFFGQGAGRNTTTGQGNSFFGSSAGVVNTGGSANAFFGREAGISNSTGGLNSFFGTGAGSANTNGFRNSFFGSQAGQQITSGDNNSFFGQLAGFNHISGSNNTLIGSGADVSIANLQYATALGSEAVVGSSNTVVLGRSADTVRVPGGLNVTGSTFLNGALALSGGSNALITGTITVSTLGAAGSTSLCRNASNQISTCSSSLRYKTSVQPFIGGLDVVRRLRPITFNWKDSGMHDVGFAAEEVEQIEPLLTTRNDKGEIEGVKYTQITTVLVNAVNEQQTQIEAQQKQIKTQQQQINQQQTEIDELKKSLSAIQTKQQTRRKQKTIRRKR